MSMVVKTIHDLSNTTLVDKMKAAMSLVTDPNLMPNYHPDFADKPGNLFYVLKEGRYSPDKGKYSIILDNDEYVSSAGWNKYELEPNVALMCTRMYIVPSRRSQYHIGRLVLPVAIEEASINHDKLWITCNDYNSFIYQWFLRSSQGKLGSLDKPWPDVYKRFKPIGIKNVYYTDQYVAELKIERSTQQLTDE